MADLGCIMGKAERKLADAHLICASCTGVPQAEPIECESLDCPWFYAREKAHEDMSMMSLYSQMTEALGLDMEDKLSQREPS